MTSEHAESVNYLCKICGKVLENVKLLSNHIAIHNENLSSCKECGKSFKTTQEWQDMWTGSMVILHTALFVAKVLPQRQI